MKPATISEEWVDLPTGSRVYVRRSGRGAPIVLLHGIAHSSDAWAPVLAPLAERHTVVALDLPGCGRSSKPDTDYSLGAQAAVVRYVLDSLSMDLVTVIGHSLGGGVAMTLAYNHPERVGRLGLVASAGLGRHLHPLFRAATLPWVPEQAMRWLFHPRARGVRNVVGRVLSHAAGDPFFFRPGEHRVEFESLLKGLEERAAQRAFLASLRSASDVGGQAVSGLDRIGLARFPVLIVWGSDDKVFPVEHAHAAAERLAGARLEIIPACGHFPQLEATDQFTRLLLDWLTTTTPTRTYVTAANVAV